MNFFEGTLLKKGEEVEINFEYSEAKIKVPYSMLYKARPAYLNGKLKQLIRLFNLLRSKYFTYSKLDFCKIVYTYFV